MDSNWQTSSYSIRPCMNGYYLNISTRRIVDVNDTEDYSHNYKDYEYIFSTWDEVSDWVKNNSIEIPPK